MKKVLIIYGLLVVGIIIIAVLRFRGINLLPTIGDFGGGKATATIENDKFNIEVADEDKERVKGLSERKNLAEDKGMVFVFDKKGKYGFWMRNVNFPLDIIYISDDTIVDIIKNAEPKALDATDIPIYEPKQEANYVLEINGGLSDKLEIQIGDKVKFDGIK